MTLMGTVKNLPQVEYQRSYNFDISLPIFASFTSTGIENYIQEVKFSGYSLGEGIEEDYGMFKSKFIGGATLPDIELTFLKPSDDVVSMYFRNWRRKAVSDTGHGYPKSRYARDVHVNLKDTAGNLSERITFQSCWPIEMPSYNLSYKTEEIMEVTFKLSVERVVFN